MENLFNFLLNIISIIASFGSWLTTPLEYINISPLALFSVGGITIIIGVHLVRLFIGG